MLKAALALAALLAVAPVMEATVAFAENDGSGAAELRAKRKAMRGGGSFSSSKQRASQQTLHTPVATGKATTVTEIVADQSVQPFLSANSTADMAAAESHYAAIVAAGGWPSVPKGTYKKGAQSSAVGALNKRLFIEGYLRAEGAQGEFADVFTSATQDSVTRFQRNMGLAVTGNVDGSTLAALNVPAANRLATIRANIARVAMYSQDLGERYIVVNVPAQQIQSVSGGKVFSQHNAIVGRPERPTPVVMTALSDINFNPYWNAPASIIERDIIPKINNGSTDILEKMNIKVFKGFGGPEIDPDTVDWDRAIADDYHFRQEPGGENAMATAKINFQSPFGIYLHDTPERQLFKSGGRFFSSGCVRVDQVAILLNWILNGQDGIDQSRIASLAETLERLDVKVTSPPQLRVAYLTSWPVGGGLAAFRSDVYQLDGTGFVIGQPMPVGETSPDGQRFVLKPIPRLVAAVDAAEAEGFTWFGRKFSGGKSASATNKGPTTSKTQTAEKDTDPAEAKSSNPAKTKSAASAKSKPSTSARTTKNGKKAYKGLFDWGNYYAEQKSDGSVKKPIKAKARRGVDPRRVRPHPNLAPVRAGCERDRVGMLRALTHRGAVRCRELHRRSVRIRLRRVRPRRRRPQPGADGVGRGGEPRRARADRRRCRPVQRLPVREDLRRRHHGPCRRAAGRRHRGVDDRARLGRCGPQLEGRLRQQRPHRRRGHQPDRVHRLVDDRRRSSG